MPVSQREAIKNFLDSRTTSHDYTPEMEVQVIVAQDNGERISGEFRGRKSFAYEDPHTGDTWKPFRIPWKSWDKPEYRDSDMAYDLSTHVEGIGMTGYDFENKRSRWVAFDFDAMTGHSDRHMAKLSKKEMKLVCDKAQEIPWVTVKTSTSGNGIHLYVYLDVDETVENHTEHAAVARSVIHKMSGLVGFDFSTRVDICGGNMWVWHRRQTDDGYKVLKQGEKLTTIPVNWRDHINVAKEKKTKVSYGRDIDQLVKRTDFHKFDKEHLRVINYFEDNNKFYWYDADHHMVVTHVCHLRDAHDDLELRGLYKTISTGTNLNEPNCFMYPLDDGGWTVRRYGKGSAEDKSWFQDGVSWTTCYLNRNPTLETLSVMFDASEDPKQGYVFRKMQDLHDAMEMIGVDFEMPDQTHYMSDVQVVPHKDNKKKLVVTIDAAGHESKFTNTSWIKKTGKKYCLVINTDLEENDVMTNYDDFVRHIVTPKGINAGWAVKTTDSWNTEPTEHVKMTLECHGLPYADIRKVLGSLVFKPWKLVVLPFQPEYPGDRQWNRNAPKLRHEPTRDGDHGSWLMILEHLGKPLDTAVNHDDWCQKAGVNSGAEYLFFWIASLIQYPTEPLPYLFLYGEKQNTGKTTFHEAIQLLFDGGVQEANIALSDTSFNAELEGCVLCVVEEVDLTTSKRASNKIKNWVTADMLSIHPKGVTPYMVKNTTHWIQTANDRGYCPVFPNDTRITYVHVSESPNHEIPKPKLFASLEEEAPSFLNALLELEIMDSETRLRIPILDTQDKELAIAEKVSSIEKFLNNQTYDCNGRYVPITEFKEAFLESLSDGQKKYWKTSKINSYMAKRYPKGKYKNTWCWGNITINEKEANNSLDFYFVTEGESLKRTEL